MSKTRIHELAKELNIPSKELIDSASKLGMDVKNHMSTLENDEITKLKGRFSKKTDKPSTESKPQTEAKPSAEAKSSTESKPSSETKPVEEKKHNKIIYDRTKEIKEEERNRNKPYDSNRPQGERKPYDPNRPQGER
ncbi:MAG: translation initiation factor IF-2 N-terminal domain-containing protein, partial [Clostridia bacterium]|nr:translation initiation factor IF-2 N-terminal domain-containing protein [Clostridia bacterium]